MSRYLEPQQILKADETSHPWWQALESDKLPSDTRALVRARTHAEEIEALTTPKVRVPHLRMVASVAELIEKGLLLTGPPGCGKSFLIDMWFSAIPTPFKVRRHYNELVLEIYRAVWEETQRRMNDLNRASPMQQSSDDSPTWNRTLRDQWRELVKKGLLPLRWKRRPWTSTYTASTSQPPIPYVVAQRLILRHWLLIFDEIQLLDVSSATLLADVLSWFWRMGGVVVGTSNKVPDDLYKNGVQRERLEPFVESLKARCPVVSMSSEQDYRTTRASTSTSTTWFTFDHESEFEDAMRAMCGDESGTPSLFDSETYQTHSGLKRADPPL